MRDTALLWWLAIAGLVFLLAGAISAVLVRLDLQRRRVYGGERWLWLALAVLLPGFGLGVYYFIRLLNAFLAPGDDGQPPLWVTRMKRPAGAPGDLPPGKGATIPAIDLLRPPAPLAPPAHPAARSPARLAVIGGPENGRTFTLARLPVVIGRGHEVEIALDADQAVSRRHAELYLHAGTLRIRDLNSAHGTQVNGRPVGDQPLQPGDRIEIGRSLLQLQVEGWGA